MSIKTEISEKGDVLSVSHSMRSTAHSTLFVSKMALQWPLDELHLLVYASAFKR